MEYPSLNHHTRYVNLPPPPPPNNFSDHHLHHHHHHHLLRPPPPSLSYPPPPPPPLHIPPPPPQSYNPHFTFLDSPNPPRFSNQSPRFDYQSDLRRVLPEPLHRRPILADEHHRRRLYSPNPQSQTYHNPRDSQRPIPSTRYRDNEYANPRRDVSNIVKHDQQVSRYVSTHSGFDVGQPVSSSSRNLEGFVEKYEPRYMTVLENERNWDRSDQDTRWVLGVKGEKNNFANRGDDGVSHVSAREQTRDYEYESSKFNRAREGREEFKQVQKKSVLLRIGKPNNTYRNRSHESNNGNFRGKDKDKDRDYMGKDSSFYLDQRMEGDRESSPVDLDVSFKSNALVAKPVVTPSSPVFDNNRTQPRNRKIKRITELDSPLRKFSERSTRSGSSSHGSECPSSSEKGSKQPKDRDSVSGAVNASGGSDGPLSFRLRKKRKVISLSSPASKFFQLIEKDDKSVNDESITKSPIASIPGAVSSHSLEESIVLEKDGSELDNITLCLHNNEKDVAALSSPLSDTSSPSLGNTNSFDDDSMANKTRTALMVSTISDSLDNDVNQQPSQNEVSLNLENDSHKVSTDGKVLLGGTGVSASSGQDQIELYAGFNAANTCHGFVNDASVKTQEMSTTVDANSSDPSSDEIITIFHEEGEVQGSLDDASRKEEESQETELLEGTTTGADGCNQSSGTTSIPDAFFTINQVKILSSKQTCFDETNKFSEDGPQESPDAVVAEDNSCKHYSPIDKGRSKGSEIWFNSSTPSEPHENVGATPSSSLKESSEEDEVLISASVETPSPDNREPSTDDGSYLLPKDNLPPTLSVFSASTDEKCTNQNDKSVESMCDMQTNIVSSQKGSSSLSSHTLISDNSVSKVGVLLNGPEPFVEDSRTSMKASHLEVTHLSTNSKTASSAPQGGSKSNLPMKKLSSASAVPTVFAGRSSPVFTNSRINKPPVNNVKKPRTWHRSTSNPAFSVSKSSSIPVPPPPKSVGMGQNSYIRSGNSLVRKGVPVSTAISSASLASRPTIHQSNPSGRIETRSTAVHNTYSITGGSSAPVLRPKTPPLSGTTKLPDLPSSPPPEHLPTKVSEYHKSPMAPEDQNGTPSNSDSQKTLDEGTAGKKIQYVKRKSNQLVAASSSDQPVPDLDKTQDGYYKRRKNQLIRTFVGEDSANTDVQRASKINNKRQTGISKKHKHLRFSSVWTLNSQSLGKDGVSLRQKLRPHLFPWKRLRNWGNTMNISASIPSNDLSSSISRKLLISRKRGMIYTKSRHGFSLRMSKLLSVGGSSLKWSKSIEKNSKRANEEATLAVAAVEKKKRDQHGSAEIKSRNNMSRDRIFRIGLFRYKMDPSRRTLQRISDEEPSMSIQSKEVIRKSYVPKRLLIGHDEYVRIGNGNQLVRNPKRRTRIFANEKVRWSLHTARSRLARKRKYCQFFTRFGKCNKDDGKCPYIHDSSKIAVCTKFLNGSCSYSDCKLTHKVIPERMQDCSYFLQGMCSNEHCPYRHVNVNSAASICDGFLKGYCADGNECRKKHTYACPVFEATGACSQGSKCKLHHPKNRNIGLKRKQQHSMERHPKKARGRYFGSIRGSESKPISEKRYLTEDDDVDILFLREEGKFTEYISLDFGNEENGDATSEERRWLLASETSDLGEGDLDELIKPIGIMNKIMLDSTSEGNLGIM